MVTIVNLDLDTSSLKIAADALTEQATRLATLLEGLPLDHWARVFELPLSDLAEALTDTGMLVAAGEGKSLTLTPHPALVNYGGLLAAICDGIEAKLAQSVMP